MPPIIPLNPANHISPIMKFLSNYHLSIEIGYALIIVILCLAIYFKTKEIYDLTSHRGLGLFRNVFLFFALAFTARAIHVVLRLTFGHQGFRSLGVVFRISLALVSLFSTIALVYLLVTTLSKKISLTSKQLFGLVSVISMVLVVPTVFWRSQAILVAVQTALIVATLLYLFAAKEHRAVKKAVKNAKKKIKISFMKGLYLLVSAFWILHIFTLEYQNTPWVWQYCIYIISIALFVYLYYRVHKRLSTND